MVTINGESEAVSGQILLDYLKEAGYDTKSVVVEINMEIIPREKWTDIVLKDEDTVEVLRFVGGG